MHDLWNKLRVKATYYYGKIYPVVKSYLILYYKKLRNSEFLKKSYLFLKEYTLLYYSNTRKFTLKWFEVFRNSKFYKILSSAYKSCTAGFYRWIDSLAFEHFSIYLSLLVLINLIMLWLILSQVLYAKNTWEGDKKFRITQGQNVSDVIDGLKSNQLIKSKFLFKVVLKLSGKDDKIIARRYVLKSGMSNLDILNALTDKSMIQSEKFTIREGYRINQIGKLAEAKLQLSAEKFLAEAGNDSLISVLGLKGKVSNLEGFLFPDTYFIPSDMDEKDLVQMLFAEFLKKVIKNKEVGDIIKQNNRDLLRIITLASIIQGETSLVNEMPMIAGVYTNRLKKHMKLEADPTVQYALPDGWKQRLKYEDLKIESLYNTYKHYGLPPGPINNPGLDAIKAAINPDKNDFLFFVATGNGGHKFSATYKEHLKAVEEYRKRMKEKTAQ